MNNNIAEQFFTKFGPLAFLPISKTQTSIVFSVFDKDLLKDKKRIIKLINFYNRFYDIKKIYKLQKFPINLSLSRNYYNKNILLFGDPLHKIHPLAGQGFNMTLRDTKILSELINQNLNLSKFKYSAGKVWYKQKFELFCDGTDFIHEFFSNKYNFKSIDKFFDLKKIFLSKKFIKIKVYFIICSVLLLLV